MALWRPNAAWAAWLLPLALLAACASSGAPRTGAGTPAERDPAPSAAGAATPSDPAGGALRAAPVPLPEVPARRGPIAVTVRHPTENLLLAVDSTFVFGTVGTGDATLRINGTPVPVANNGAFLAYLPTPPADNPLYAFEVVRDGSAGDTVGGSAGSIAGGIAGSSAGGIADTAEAQSAGEPAREPIRHTLRVRRPSVREFPDTGRLVVDSGSVRPRGALQLRDSEWVPLRVRAAQNATAWLQDGTGARIPLVSPAPGGNGFAGEARAVQLTAAARMIVARGRDTVRLPLAVPDLITPAAPRRFGTLRNRTGGLVAQSDSDKVVIARPVPDGFYKWSLLPGTQVELTGREGGQTRVRLDSQLEAWVTTGDIVPLPEGTPGERRVSGGLRVEPAEEWVDVVIPTGARPAFLMEPDSRRLVLTLYDTQISPEISPLLGNDPLVQQLAWEPVATDRTVLQIRLSQPVYGWLTLWDERRNALVVRVRRIPRIDPARPLAGLTLAVDAGHPPGGATGPTGLTEADAVLPVAELLKAMLEERGATVFMTRTTRDAVGLTDRPVLARRANVHAFLSVHLNAFGDGVNPFERHGTSTLFFHQPSEPLSREIQRALMPRIGQRDLGVHYQNLAVARATWYPSALAEGLFLMFPAQEAAMRTEEWRRRYAEGIAEGVAAYFRTLGGRE